MGRRCTRRRGTRRPATRHHDHPPGLPPDHAPRPRPPAPLAALAALATLVVLLLALPAGATAPRHRPARHERRRPSPLSCAGEGPQPPPRRAAEHALCQAPCPQARRRTSPRRRPAKPTAPPVELVPAVCEDGTLPSHSGGGPYSCEDGSAPACEEGTLVRAAATAGPMCAVKAATGNCECTPRTERANARRSNSPAKTERRRDVRRTANAPSEQRSVRRRRMREPIGGPRRAARPAAERLLTPSAGGRACARSAPPCGSQVGAVQHHLLGREAQRRRRRQAPRGARAPMRVRAIVRCARKRRGGGSPATVHSAAGDVALQLRQARRRGRGPRPPARAGAAAAATPARPSRSSQAAPRSADSPSAAASSSISSNGPLAQEHQGHVQRLGGEHPRRVARRLSRSAPRAQRRSSSPTSAGGSSAANSRAEAARDIAGDARRSRRSDLAEQHPPDEVHGHRRRAVADVGPAAGQVHRAGDSRGLSVRARRGDAQPDQPDGLLRASRRRARRCP